MRVKERGVVCAFLKRPVIFIPVLLLVNLFFIHLYGIPMFDQNAASDEKMGAIVARGESGNDPLLKIKLRNSERLQNISQVCDRYNRDQAFRELGLAGTALGTADNKIFYCLVPKVGCTYWKRIIRFIGSDYKGHFKIPENIPRLYAHFGPYRNTTVIQLRNISNTDVLKYKFKFMFTRDPYERLWSGYLDKLYLPDFWWWLGTEIINITRPNATARSIECGHDVSFEEFLLYMTNKLKDGELVNSHFAPVYTLCNPCVINFDVIGKLETFHDDTNLVLQETNIFVGNKDDKDKDLAKEEVQSLVKYNFDVLDRLKQKTGNSDCFGPLSIAYRLWKTFQFNGYISDKIKFPSSVRNYADDLSVLKRSLVKRIIYLRESARSETKAWKNQRQKYLKLAYKSVSPIVLKAVEQTFTGDLELFGYEKGRF